jgi:formiminoglutamase
MAEMTSPPWLNVRRGNAPLLLCMPHTGTQLPASLAPLFRSAWLARRDTDWYVERLYSFAAGLDATLVRTEISRSVIDANRDPSGASLYPGQATTELCPTTTFDGEPLYREDLAPGPEQIAGRRSDYFAPYHDAIAAEIARLRARHAHVVVYDCHSIRSRIPRLFEGLLPHLNLGTFSGASCAPAEASASGATWRSCAPAAASLAARQGRPADQRRGDGARLPRLCARAQGRPRGQLAAALG